MKSFLGLLMAFFGPGKSSIQGFLNVGELGKSLLTAFGASSLVGLAVAVLSAIASNASAEFPSPVMASLVAFALVQVADQLRRLDHGATPNPAGVIPLAPESPAPGGSVGPVPFYQTLGPALAAFTAFVPFAFAALLLLSSGSARADEPSFAHWLNGQRVARGLRPVGVDPALTAAAAHNNAAQQSQGMGHHVMGPARRQNAGAGPEPAVWGAWVSSPAHASALFDPSVTAIGYDFDGRYTTYSGR